MTELFAVVLAGGSGMRFWPRSREQIPKQLCNLGNSEKTMLVLTLERFEGIIPKSKRLIVTHQKQFDLTKKVSKGLVEKIISEPEAKNTSAALVMAALEIHRQNPEALMVSVHADHVIPDVESFQTTVNNAAEIAEKKNAMVLLGIRPQYPETAYGYIEKGGMEDPKLRLYTVKKFREKPDRETAQTYVDSGNFYWNAGLFVWKVSTLLAEVKEYLPNTYQELSKALGAKKSFAEVATSELTKAYSKLDSISIDNAVLERSKNILVIEAQFNWQDIGSWDALPSVFGADKNQNFLRGDTLIIDSQGCVIDTDGPLVAALGVKDHVVVVANGAVLVCPKSRSQDVKKIVEQLKKQNLTKFI